METGGVADHNEVTTPTKAKSMKNPFRRFVKAKAQPPPLNVEAAVLNDEVGDDADEVKELAASPLINSPALAREHEKEVSEKWRQERLQANAAKQRKDRNNELQQRRLSSSKSPVLETSTHHEPVKIPPAFSVEPKFPEHKRSGDNAALPMSPRDDEPLEKRSRMSIDETANDSSSAEDELPEKSGENRRLLLLGCMVAIGAVVAVLSVRFAKRR